MYNNSKELTLIWACENKHVLSLRLKVDVSRSFFELDRKQVEFSKIGHRRSAFS
jgi:hypothetical protein